MGRYGGMVAYEQTARPARQPAGGTTTSTCEDKPCDVAPNLYPAAIGVWPSVTSGWAVMVAVRGAEPSVERSAADRRATA